MRAKEPLSAMLLDLGRAVAGAAAGRAGRAHAGATAGAQGRGLAGATAGARGRGLAGARAGARGRGLGDRRGRRLCAPPAAAGAVALAALVLAGLLGCRPAAERLADGRDPLAALGSPAESRLWDLAFWVEQQGTGSELWRRGFAFCRRHPGAAYPNCRTVRIASWWTGPAPAAAPARPAALPLPPSPSLPSSLPAAARASAPGAATRAPEPRP